MGRRELALEFRIPIAIIVVVAKPVPKADMSIPPVGVGTLDEMNLMATAAVGPPPEVTAIRQLVFEFGDVLVAE